MCSDVATCHAEQCTENIESPKHRRYDTFRIFYVRTDYQRRCMPPPPPSSIYFRVMYRVYAANICRSEGLSVVFLLVQLFA